jgi:D-alanine-D-alanine ligase
MIEVAIIAGGPSAERGISLKSAQTIAKHLPADKYIVTTIDAMPNGWTEISTGRRIDLNRFCLLDEAGQEAKRFGFAFLFIHGTPVEDGKMQGYFEMMGIPHSACGVLSSALTFNKQTCKDHLVQYGIPMAASMVVREIVTQKDAENHSISLPCFVKPNNNGSSYGVTKVKAWDQLADAISFALQYDHEVMIERALNGREYSNGVVRDGDKLHVLPITEIIPKGEFFDFAAKYEGESEEITPAHLDAALTEQCQQRSKLLYQLLQCRGMVRFDYILENGTFYLLEANTTPGMSEASIIPQQARAYGWTLGEFLDIVVRDGMANPHGARVPS